MKSGLFPFFILSAFILAVLGVGEACIRASSRPSDLMTTPSGSDVPAPGTASNVIKYMYSPPTRIPGAPILTPTPDPPHAVPTPRNSPDQYTVKAGDTLRLIADAHGVSIEQIMEASSLSDPNVLSIGQMLTIPVPTPVGRAPEFKVIPDSELVNGPYSSPFSVEDFISSQGGYLVDYHENVNGEHLSGAQIVALIARDYSVNPRLLLAVLEYQGGWVTKPKPETVALDYPIGRQDPDMTGLYKQLSWAANELNRGYYLWKVNAVNNWILADSSVVVTSATINAGTGGVQNLFARLDNLQEWLVAIYADGLALTYSQFFGYPFDYTFDPIVPADLSQPVFQLPFEPGVTWYLTSGPHGGWGSGSAWAGLDFAPPGEKEGCLRSNDWVVAITDGLIIRAENGAVVQDLDGDGLEQTGWTILYMHIESRERVQVNTFLRAGERVGHPSCEGGVSTGTHVHLARRYNGEWIPADGPLPFVLDGWVSVGFGSEYNGGLRRNGQNIEALDERSPKNEIER